MLANFLIGLREGLEAALVVSILIAYVVKSGRREHLPKIWLGIGVAILVPLTLGLILTFGPRGLSFQAKEFIGGSLSIVAVALVTGMIFWMATAARTISSTLRAQVDHADEQPWKLVIIAVLAVGREGLETALILWAATQSASRDTGTGVPLIGAVLGILVAAGLGYLLYRGAIKINLSRFFTWTGAFLILVAAGVLSYGVHDLQEARFLPGLYTLAYDVSSVVSLDGVLGTLAKGIFNFSPAATVLEVVVWFAYAIPVMILFLRRVRRGTPPNATTTNATTTNATTTNATTTHASPIPATASTKEHS